MTRQFGTTAFAGAAALLALGAVTVACSSPNDRPVGATTSTAGNSRLADFSAQFSAVSMDRSCTTDVGSAECGRVTAQKIDLVRQVEPELKAAPDTGLVGDARQVGDRILSTANTWSESGCQAKPATQACAAPATAVESDFSVLSAYLLQISGG